MFEIKGLELSKKYFEEIGRPAFESMLPELLSCAAIGLVGEGSECFGFDDEISKDHDWGPGFCIWLSRSDYAKYGNEAERTYESLPSSYLGYERQRESIMSMGRVGVHEISDFYFKYLGIDHAPESFDEWRSIPEKNISVATNGAVWQDPKGTFSSIRGKLLSYYPEDVRKKKIAMHASIAAQSGQYNYYRCMQREDLVAAELASAEFIDHIQAIVFLLNLKYQPYYKWANRALKQLPILGNEIATKLAKMVKQDDKAKSIEEISNLVISAFKAQGLSTNNSDFLLHHAEEIMSNIQDEELRNTHIMSL